MELHRTPSKRPVEAFNGGLLGFHASLVHLVPSLVTVQAGALPCRRCVQCLNSQDSGSQSESQGILRFAHGPYDPTPEKYMDLGEGEGFSDGVPFEAPCQHL